MNLPSYAKTEKYQCIWIFFYMQCHPIIIGWHTHYITPKKERKKNEQAEKKKRTELSYASKEPVRSFAYRALIIGTTKQAHLLRYLLHLR